MVLLTPSKPNASFFVQYFAISGHAQTPPDVTNTPGDVVSSLDSPPHPRLHVYVRYLCPPTLTRNEQAALLKACAEHPRDSLLLSLALGTGLRLAEIVGLLVGDLFHRTKPKSRFLLRREIAKGGRASDVFLPNALMTKLVSLWRYKTLAGESTEPDAPLFCNQSGVRISKRRVQLIFKHWQREAGFERLYPIHALRHTAVTNVYRSSRDLFLAQRFARHVSPLTTIIYTNPTDEELFGEIRDLKC